MFIDKPTPVKLREVKPNVVPTSRADLPRTHTAARAVETLHDDVQPRGARTAAG